MLHGKLQRLHLQAAGALHVQLFASKGAEAVCPLPQGLLCITLRQPCRPELAGIVALSKEHKACLSKSAAQHATSAALGHLICRALCNRAAAAASAEDASESFAQLQAQAVMTHLPIWLQQDLHQCRDIHFSRGIEQVGHIQQPVLQVCSTSPEA